MAHLQAVRPFAVLLPVLAVVALAIALASKLTLEPGFEPLLPQNSESVRELHRVAEKTAGVSTLFVVLEVPANRPPAEKELRAAGDALAEELRKIGEPYVGTAVDGAKDAVQYLEPRAGLFASADDLRALQSDVDARWQYEVTKSSGQLLDESTPPPPLDETTFRTRLHLDRFTPADRFPGGYFESADGRALVVAVRSKVPTSDTQRGAETIRRVRAAALRVDLPKYRRDIRYGLAGDLYTAVADVSSLNKDLLDVGVLGAVLIAGSVLLFYLRARTLVVMLLTILTSTAWTAGVARVLVGHLNIASCFVFTIVAGTGLNSAVIYMARFLEERRAGATLERGLLVAHRETIGATSAACAASTASFASLVVPNVRGFREFGAIGAIGLLLSWIATILCLPAFLAAFERVKPIVHGERATALTELRQKWGGAFGKPFAWVVSRAPRSIALAGVALSIAGFAGLYAYIAHDPMEYDLRRLERDPETRPRAEHFDSLAKNITGDLGTDGMVMLVDRPEQVEPLREALYARRDAAPSDEKPFSSVIALQDFVPTDQAEKIPILLDLSRTLRRMHARKGFSDGAWSKIAPYLAPPELAPIAMADLPEGLAAPFTETDGTRGRILYVAPTEAGSYDARHLLRWAASYRETVLPDGSRVLGSGRAVIYADMWSAVLSAVPIAVFASIAAVVLVVLLTFRRGRFTLYVLTSLLIGVGWMAAGLVLFRMKLNFMNFVALPITFGIGVEYSVNVVDRYRREGRGGILKTIRETGGAVVLCSMTTTFGYLALSRSSNFAVRSLGYTAVLGEISTLLSAMLVLPAALVWIDRRRVRRQWQHVPVDQRGVLPS